MRSRLFFQNDTKNNKLRKIEIIFLVVVIVSIIIWFVKSNLLPVSGDFRNNLWGPTYLLLHKMSPYNIKTIFDGLNPVWMPVIIGAGLPVGFLPLKIASNLWFLLSVFVLFAMVALFSLNLKRRELWTFSATIAFLSFPSTVAHIKYGQISLLISLCLLLIAKFYKKIPPILLGLLFALSITKPQLIVLFIFSYAATLIREVGFRKLLTVFFYALLWMIFFCLPLFILYPGWVPDFINNILTNPNWEYPTVFSLFRSNLNSPFFIYGLGFLYLILGISIVIFLAIKLEGFNALLWSMALTPLFSPVIWSWDFVLIYPLLLFLGLSTSSKWSRAIIICGFTLCSVTFIVMKNIGLIQDKYAIWVPYAMTIIMTISYVIYQRKKIEIPLAKINISK